MPLPSLEQSLPQFEIVIPSTGISSVFRPFLVKEEKLLLLAMEEDDERRVLDTIVQVLKACSLNSLNVEALANFDLEYIFLQLRARSVDSKTELRYKCHNMVEISEEEAKERAVKKQSSLPWAKRKKDTDEPLDLEMIIECGSIVTIPIDLDEVKVQFNPEHQKQIMLTETLGVTMKYPNVTIAKAMIRTKDASKKDTTVNDALSTIAMSIETVFDETQVYTSFSQKEMLTWIESLTQGQFAKMQQFFETAPKLAHDVDFICAQCGYTEKLHLEGLATFFG
jgi:transcriptional regulator with GAF, ATPase, and Fis domain